MNILLSINKKFGQVSIFNIIIITRKWNSIINIITTKWNSIINIITRKWKIVKIQSIKSRCRWVTCVSMLAAKLTRSLKDDIKMDYIIIW